jgi:hypothetical protein
MKKQSKPGYIWAWSELTEKLYPERKSGTPLKYPYIGAYSNNHYVPASWVEKGYVIEIPEPGI